MKIKCPHCNKEHGIELRTGIPNEQKMSVTITSESEYIAADAIGGLLTNMTKVLQAVAKNIAGKVGVFVYDITVAKKKVRIDLFVMSAKKKRRIKKRPTTDNT